MFNWYLRIAFPFLLGISFFLRQEANHFIVAAKKEETTSSSDEYLYHTEEAAGIVIDYEPPPVTTLSTVSKEDGTTTTAATNILSSSEPAFIYGPNQGPRVVEFYAPWCPHCQHFRKHYIKFAHQVQAIMKEFGVEGPPVQFYAVSCTANKKLCRAQGITGYPKIKLYAAGVQQNATAEVVYWKLHVFDVLDALKIQVQHLQVDPARYNNAVENTGDSDRLRTKKSVATSPHQRTKQQVFDDAYLSFDFNLRNAIFLNDGPLTNQTKAVFRRWLELVKLTTPVVWQIRTVINAILSDFDKVTTNEDFLLQILDQHPPPSPQWSLSCTKGVTGMGYSCGLWQLIHIVSVGLVEYNLMIGANDDHVLSELSITTTDAAETIRNFVEHFFACDICRTNFLQAYDACAHDRCHRLSADEMDTDQWIQFPIWLFETHNAVNVRLLHERAQREHRSVSHANEIQAQWPTRTACPICWLDSEGWDDEIVYKYLRTEYWSEDFVSAEYRALVTSNADGTNDQDDNNRRLLATIPILQLIEWCVVATLMGVWYSNRAQRIRSGLHKKRDADC